MRDIIRAFENFDFNQIVREATRRKWKPRRIGLNEITNFTSCFFFFFNNCFARFIGAIFILQNSPFAWI